MGDSWQLWRSRELKWLKPRKNGKGEEIYYDKAGRTYGAEHVRQEFERMPEEDKHESMG